LVNCRTPETGLAHGVQEKIELQIAEPGAAEVEIETCSREGRAIEARAIKIHAIQA
jgi:hypothetical protein